MDMELKDKLKKLRQDKGLTQAQLAEALFVSRSTVAKWENGLGLPGPDSMAALEELFGIPQEEVATTEPETVIMEKNRKLHIIGQGALWVGVLTVTVLAMLLPFAIHSGHYGLTTEMAAGAYTDSKYIDTGDYRIYYFQFEGEWEDGHHWSSLQGFRPVQKHFWGCTVSEEDYAYRVFTKNNYVVGILYSIKGKDGYYNLIKKAGIYKAPEQQGEPMTWDIPAELITADSVSINGEDYELREGFFFITTEPVEYFEIGNNFFDVE
jgi:transcriptional regulator with XRE-family HTH domain